MRRELPVWTVVASLSVWAAEDLRAQRFFHGPQPIALTEAPDALEVLDLDLDGAADIPVVHGGAASIRVLWNEGDGAFSESGAMEAGHGAVWIVGGDLDGSGRPDLVVANAGASTLSVLLDGGVREFRPSRHVAMPVPPRMARLADLDRDGALDAITADFNSNASGRLTVLPGDGRGSFGIHRVLPLGDNTHSLAVDDFDGDGAVDVAVGHWPDNTLEGTISWFAGRGDGTFRAPRATILDAAPGRISIPRFLESADIDRDGRKEIAVLVDKGDLLLLRHRPGDTFGIEIGLVDTGAALFELRDIDGDGAEDCVAVRRLPSGHGIGVYRGTGAGTFDEPRTVPLPSVKALAFRLADLTGDGGTDAVIGVTHRDGGEVLIVRGTPSGSFEGESAAFLDSPPRSLTGASFEGRTALIALTSRGLLELEKTPDGALVSRPWNELEAGRLPGSLERGDFDGDGDTDLALTDLVRGEALFFDPESLDTFRSVKVGDLPALLAAGDFDRDGATDLAVTDRISTAFFLIAKGASSTIDLAEPQGAVAAHDLDLDGHADLALATKSGLRLLFGDGHGGFPRRTSISDLPDANALAVGDLDRDGFPDIVAARTGRVSIFSAPGGAEPRTPRDLLTGGDSLAVEVADLDGDGLAEVLAASDRHVLVFPGTETGFGPPERYAVGSFLRALAVLDMDEDGALECAAADYTSSLVVVLNGASGPRPWFRRGDIDGDSRAGMTDAIVLLDALFRGGGPVACPDAADSDDDGMLGITDAIRLLLHLFAGGEALPSPGSTGCGMDPSTDDLPACREPCAAQLPGG